MKKLLLLLIVPLLSFTQNDNVQINLGHSGTEGMDFGIGFKVFKGGYLGLSLGEYNSHNLEHDITFSDAHYTNAVTFDNEEFNGLQYGVFFKKYFKEFFIYASYSGGNSDYKTSNSTLSYNTESFYYLTPNESGSQVNNTLMSYTTETVTITNSNINESLLESKLGLGYSYKISEKFRMEASIFTVMKQLKTENSTTSTATTTGYIPGYALGSYTNYTVQGSEIVYGSTWVPGENISQEVVSPTLNDGTDDYLKLGLSFSFVLTL